MFFYPTTHLEKWNLPCNFHSSKKTKQNKRKHPKTKKLPSEEIRVDEIEKTSNYLLVEKL